MDKVLVAAPVSIHKDYCLFRWIDWIKQLTYPCEILLVDNSPDPDYHKKIQDLGGLHVLHIEPKGNPVQFIAKSQEIIRQVAIKNNMDYLMMIECDVFPPLNIIEHLKHYRTTVVSGNYFLAHGEDTCLSIQEIEHDFHRKQVGRLSPYESFRYFDGSLSQVFGTHLGCTLIHKTVFKTIPFRSDTTLKERAKLSTFSDTYFFVDCIRNDIPVYSDMSVMCTHERRSWDELIHLNYDN